jgi:hypothetical protein
VRTERKGEVQHRRTHETRSTPTTTVSQTACHRRPRPSALPGPPRCPAIIKPPPSPVRRRPGHPSRPGCLLFSGVGRSPPPPTLSLFLASTGAAASGLVDRHRHGVCRGRAMASPALVSLSLDGARKRDQER